MTPPAAPARDAGADYLKAAAIFGVVFIHTPGSGAGSVDEVFRFCVPVFVGLWAYYFEQGLARRPADQHARYARDKFIRLLIPYLFWTAVYVPIRHPLAEWADTPFLVHLDRFAGNGWPGQYFFIILFQLIPLVRLTRWAFGPRIMWLLIATGPLLYLLVETTKWGYPVVSQSSDRIFVYWLSYVALGMGLARGYIPRLPGVPLAIVAAVALLLAPTEVRALERVSANPSRMILVSVCVGSLALLLALGPRPSGMGIGAVSSGSGGWFDAMIGYIGRNTLPIFVLNILVLTLVGDSFKTVVPATRLAGAAGRAGLALFAIAVSLGIGWAFRRVRLAR